MYFSQKQGTKSTTHTNQNVFDKRRNRNFDTVGSAVLDLLC